MRFISWNCRGGIARKLPILHDLGRDVAVLSEVPEEPPAPTLSGPSISWSSVSDGSNRALAIAGFGTGISRVSPPPDAGVLSTAATTDDGLGVLSICARKPQGSSYGAQVMATIDAYGSWLRSSPRIVAGDFNIAPGRDQDRRTGHLRSVFDALGELGYVSLYHHVTGDAYGEERLATYFHHRREDNPWHIDFCFVHTDLASRVTAFELGTFDDWIAPAHSDHVPLIVDFDIGH